MRTMKSKALRTQELSQKKNELSQHIKVCRATIAEKKLYIETTQKEIKRLDEEISVKQNSDKHNKETAKCLRALNTLLLQYENTLKAELESKKASYCNDKDVYEERIASYRATFQSHKEYYLQNPLAQKLLMAQAEKEEIECRLKICDDQITMKQIELDRLTDPKVACCSTEDLPDSVYVQQPTTEQEEQLDVQEKVDCDMSIDLTSLKLDQSRNGQANSEEIPDENPLQDQASDPASQTSCTELWSSPQSDEQSQSAERHFEDQDQIASQLKDNLEQQSTVSYDQEAVEKQSGATGEEPAHSKDRSEEPAVFPSTPSQETNVHSFLAKMTPVSSTSTSPLNLSPSSSPRQGTSETKSPYFLFSSNSNPSTPGFAGFGFEQGSSQEESPFAFTGSLFTEKKTTESKSPGCPEFLFGQPEQSEDFQFDFASESPQAAKKGDSRQDFPFSFNF
ncbi:uncharacterized protein LOC115402754 isoform X2 [Salarias fasciatus]|uniref:uncharacterized protein LOC115402754 isoform X2 n=1 Tax=Salarias fasciatus TaxID=181472 RepID=UPI0011769812|nr:uncharacterized protein LOC115402754 isoform X2 [Salarias fasciatus]